MAGHPGENVSISVKLRFHEFKIPPVHDALILGKKAPIGSEAMERSLKLLHVAPFERIELTGDNEDDIVGHILVRGSILNKIPQDKIIRLILERVKPFMAAEEILHLHIETELSLEHEI